MGVYSVMAMTDEDLENNVNFAFETCIKQLGNQGLIPMDNAKKIIDNYGVVLVRKGRFRGVLDKVLGNEEGRLTYRVVDLGVKE